MVTHRFDYMGVTVPDIQPILMTMTNLHINAFLHKRVAPVGLLTYKDRTSHKIQNNIVQTVMHRLSLVPTTGV